MRVGRAVDTVPPKLGFVQAVQTHAAILPIAGVAAAASDRTFSLLLLPPLVMIFWALISLPPSLPLCLEEWQVCQSTDKDS